MKNLLSLWPNLTRAYEIAFLGEHTIQIVFDDNYEAGYKDFELIKEFFTGVEFVSDGDLIVELSKPTKKEYENSESLKDLHLRVLGVSDKNPIVWEYNKKTEDISKTLLDVADERLDFSIDEKAMIFVIARTIARLEGSEFIETNHIAEAINYKIRNANAIHNAVVDNINFGGEIIISKGNLNPIHVSKAIDYLKSLIE